MFSTGSPLVPESFDYVYRDIKPDLLLASISGGTDILSCFALGNPILPVYRGELQCRGLGMAVDVFDDDGPIPVPRREGRAGVHRKPFPAMPIGFWNDPTAASTTPPTSSASTTSGATATSRDHRAWRADHLRPLGRTLNPGGVRIGTAEIYRQVEKLPEVVESLVIGQDWPPQNPNDVRVVLFVKLREGLALDDALKSASATIRDNTTPRHVPAKVLQVADIPRTKSGKIVELAVRNVVHGRAGEEPVEALANPEALGPRVGAGHPADHGAWRATRSLEQRTLRSPRGARLSGDPFRQP
jgi:acetoacetyl-CoA synthetase